MKAVTDKDSVELAEQLPRCPDGNFIDVPCEGHDRKPELLGEISIPIKTSFWDKLLHRCCGKGMRIVQDAKVYRCIICEKIHASTVGYSAVCACCNRKEAHDW